MTYYRTIDEDLQRAKKIISAGDITGGNILAALKLLESFVNKIEKDRFYYRDLEEAMRRVAKEVKGAPSMVLHDNLPYKVIPEDLADWIEKLV